jgi:hypothetical protein
VVQIILMLNRAAIVIALIACFLAGGFFFSFLCRDFNFNLLRALAGGDDVHAEKIETSTTYTPRTIEIQPPSVAIDEIEGQELTDADRQVVSRYRSHIPNAQEGKNPSVRLKAGMTSNLPNVLGLFKGIPFQEIPSITIDPRSDRLFKTEFTAERPLVTNVVLPDTSFTHTQQVKYHFLWYTDPIGRSTYGFKFDPSPIEAVVIDRQTTVTVFKRPWLRVSPEIGMNALNMSEWFVAVNLSIRYHDFWVKGSAELPMKKDPKLSIPVAVEYDLITLER